MGEPQRRSQDRPGTSSVLAATVLLLAGGLRLWGGLHHPFVQDELYTLIDATWLFDSPLETGIAARPLYYLLQHLLLPVLPENEIGLRVLPLLFGLAGVWATWALAREVFDRRAAAAAGLLVAIAPWHLYISEMARYWSLVYLLISVFLLSHLKLRAGAAQRRWGLVGFSSLVLGSLTHPTFLFPVIGIFCWDVWRAWRGRNVQPLWRRPVVQRIWLPYAVFATLALGILVLSGGASTVQERASRGLGPFLRLLPAVAQWITPALLVGAAVAVIAFFFSGRPRWRHWAGLAASGGISTVLLLLVAASVSEVYTDYAVGLLPLVVVSLGGVVCAIHERTSRASSAEADGVTLAVVALMVFATLPSTVSHVIDGTRFDLRPAFDFVRSADAELPVYTSPIAIQDRYAGDLAGRSLSDASPSDFEKLSETTDFWVVAPLRRYGLGHDPTGAKRRWLVEHCPERLSYERPRFDYRQYRVKVFRCGPGRRG